MTPCRGSQCGWDNDEEMILAILGEIQQVLEPGCFKGEGMKGGKPETYPGLGVSWKLCSFHVCVYTDPNLKPHTIIMDKQNK